MTPIAKRLTAIGRPMVSIHEIATIGLDMSYSAFWSRLRMYRGELTPLKTFKAGGAEMMMIYDAVAWAENHAREYADKMREIGYPHLVREEGLLR